MNDPIERALTYPYGAPERSYLFADGAAHPYFPGQAREEGRIPVIGYGSNRSPERLVQKYGEPGHRIPVETAWLEGYDVVYAARLSGYGAVPATIAPCPGCRLPVKLTWLSLHQLPAMHASEGVGRVYDFGELEAPLEGEHSGPLGRAFVYINRGGAYAPNGQPIPLAEIGSEQRAWTALHQPEMQKSLADWLQPGASAEEFAATTLSGDAIRRERAGRMAERAVRWHHPSFRRLSQK